MITGRNAQGKTNLIEAIWLMTGCRSFRGTRERDYIGFDKDYAEINLSFRDNSRTQKITFRICRGIKEKKILLNGVQCSGGKKLFEQFKCIAFLPSDIELAEGSPEKRRFFIDLCCSQIKPSAMEYIRKYELISAHRNAVLKSIAYGNGTKENLAVWNEQLAVIGANIALMRHIYAEKSDSVCRKLYSGITENTEELSVSYHSNIYPNDYIFPDKVTDEMTDIYKKKLDLSADDDIRLGYTQYGIHRDDLNLRINGLPVKIYGSQGQKKSCALVMKLAQADILRNESNEPPVILLDDVMSELDASRQKLVSEIIDGMQVFITSCSTESVMINSRCSICRMENGVLEQL